MPLLTLNMIVRNEAKTLARAIRSFEGLADEVVVIDTGSTDGSVEIAKECGAIVEHVPWNDDFSEARNIGFSLATGEWMFVLDADEWLMPESVEECRLIMRTGREETYRVVRRDISPAGWSEMFFIRLGRRRVKPHLVGRIHEHFETPPTSVGTANITLVHEGYSKGLRLDKMERNIHLLELELRDRPGQLYYQIDLTHQYFLKNDPKWRHCFDEAAAQLDLNAPKPPLSLAMVLLEIAMQRAAEGESPLLPREMAAELAGRWYPRSVPLLVERAKLAFAKADFELAVELVAEALSLWTTGAYDRTISFNPSIMGGELQLNYGVALFRLERIEEALKAFDEAAKDPRVAQAAIGNAQAIRAAIGGQN